MRLSRLMLNWFRHCGDQSKSVGNKSGENVKTTWRRKAWSRGDIFMERRRRSMKWCCCCCCSQIKLPDVNKLQDIRALKTQSHVLPVALDGSEPIATELMNFKKKILKSHKVHFLHEKFSTWAVTLGGTSFLICALGPFKIKRPI